MDYSYSIKQDHWKQWVAETKIPLGHDRRELRVTTSKSSRGGVRSTASVVQVNEDGFGYTHAFGLGKPGSGDYSKTVLVEPATRVTEKVIRAAHEKALAGIDTVLAEATAYYLPEPSKIVPPGSIMVLAT